MQPTSLQLRTKAYSQIKNVQTYPVAALTKQMSVPHPPSNGCAPLLLATQYMPGGRIYPSIPSNFRIPAYGHIPPDATHVSYVPTSLFSDAWFRKPSPEPLSGCSTKELPFYIHDAYISTSTPHASLELPNDFYPKLHIYVCCFYLFYG